MAGAKRPATLNLPFSPFHPSVARTTRRNTTPRLPSARPEALSPQSSVLSPVSSPFHPFLLFAVSIAASIAASGCRFRMPLLVAVWQNKITVRYNTADQLQISKESGS